MDEVDFYLFDLESKFKKLQNLNKEYYLSYSGGKDSHLLLWFIKSWLKENDNNLYEWCNNNISIVGCNTYLEHPEILKRIYKHSDIVLTPKIKPMEIKEKYGIPCFSKEQDFYIYYYQLALIKGKIPSPTILQKMNGTYYTGFNVSKKARDYVKSGEAHMITHLCCKYLKKEPFKEYEKKSKRKAILGIRSGESQLRKKQYKSCFTKDKKFTPLYDLSSELEDRIYKKYQIEIPTIYNYVERTGCMGCPYGSYKKDTQKELELLSPQQREYICELFKESYEILGILKKEEK